MNSSIEIGVIGGTGFYALFNEAEEVMVDTPYGLPSAKLALGKVGERRVAFIPRHGKDHEYPPHRVNYRANLFALKKLGVKYLISTCAAGSLHAEIKPGDLVVCDQFVDRTWGREDTFYHGPKTVHVSVAEPYCLYLRKMAYKLGMGMKLPVHPEGTVVVINGPRFSSRAESDGYRNQGWQVINMTQYPEVVLARELEMCVVNLALITDYDTGVKEDLKIKPVSAKEAVAVFERSNDSLKKLVLALIEKVNIKRECICHHALKDAVLN